MMELNRKIIPAIALPEKFELKKPIKNSLSNGINIFHIPADNIEVVKLELVFSSGIWDQPKPLIALFTSKLLKEGTKEFSSSHIAEMLDYYGAYLQCQHSHHFISVTLYAVKKQLKHLMHVLESIIKQPVFDDNELAISVANKRQEYLFESEKVKTLALRGFNKSIFGENHPYGNHLKLSNFDDVKRDDLFAFHQDHFHASNCTIFVTGKLGKDVEDLIEVHFGGEWNGAGKKPDKQFSMPGAAAKNVFVPKKDAIQVALRMGRTAISKEHPDFHGLNVLTTVLGGYFGSRLMKNIREEKGYTYGIGAQLLSNKNESVLSVQCEMASENALATLNEIYSEFSALRDELVSEDELDMVRNYLLGELARSFDGPFALAESHMMLWLFNLDSNHIEDYLKTLKTITPQQLQSLACSYLNEEDWTVVVAGNPKLKKDFQKK